jgi:uncharacterized protein YgiM (DUF1202 family)
MLRLSSGVLIMSFLLVSSCGSSGTATSVTEGTSERNPVAWSTVEVTGNVVNLRAGPGTVYSVLGQVDRGDSLQVTGGLEDWYRVYVPGLSLFAWIYAPLTSGTELP